MDADGQPAPAIHRQLRSGRSVDELIGLCKGVICDGEVSQGEAEFLMSWLEANISSCDEWPVNVLFERVERMLGDGVLDSAEQSELTKLLVQVSGGNPSPFEAHSLSTSLPLNDPPPPLLVAQKSFCLTGKFLVGTRSHCESLVSTSGGLVRPSVSATLDYLVVGVVGSRDWLHSTFGTKIAKAVEYREKGYPISIVSEEWLCRALQK